MMDQLRNLVRRYAANEIDYRAFRAALVAQFSAASDVDARVESLYDLIESACSAFENHFIGDEGSLKIHLFGAACPVVVPQNVASNILGDFVLNVRPNFVRYAQPTSGNSIAAFQTVGSASMAEEAEYELEEAV